VKARADAKRAKIAANDAKKVADKARAELEKAQADLEKAKRELEKLVCTNFALAQLSKVIDAEADEKAKMKEADRLAEIAAVAEYKASLAEAEADSLRWVEKGNGNVAYSSSIIEKSITLPLHREREIDEIFSILPNDSYNIEWTSNNNEIVQITRYKNHIGIRSVKKEGSAIIEGRKNGKVKYHLNVIVNR